MAMHTEKLLPGHQSAKRRAWSMFRAALATLGPGIMVCFADTDGPCLITAAQSGAEFHYDLLSVQLLLVPILFFAQELTVRLGIVHNKGVTALLKEYAGKNPARMVAAPLLASCILGLVSEYMVIGQTMQFWDVPVWFTSLVVTATLLALACSGSYSLAEKVGLLMGMCQIAFFGTVMASSPDSQEVAAGLAAFPLHRPSFVKLVTANIGAVIMPWMLAYQQSAICNKGLGMSGEDHLFLERIDTAVGSVLTQGVMGAMLITVAAMVPAGSNVDSVWGLLDIFTVLLGNKTRAMWLLTFAVIGACMVAAIVQTLCAAWVLEELFTDTDGGERQISYSSNLRERPVFLTAYACVCFAAVSVTLLTGDEVDLSVLTEFVNGILMPPVVFALWYLSAYTLPVEHRLHGFYKWMLFAVFAICSGFCIGSMWFSFQDDD